MKENIEVLYEATVHLLSELKKLEEGSSNREQIVENIQTMINQRDQLIGSIEGPYMEYDQALGKRIISINGKIKNGWIYSTIRLRQTLKIHSGEKKKHFLY